jgi:hypothetical protein
VVAIDEDKYPEAYHSPNTSLNDFDNGGGEREAFHDTPGVQPKHKCDKNVYENIMISAGNVYAPSASFPKRRYNVVIVRRLLT